MTDPKPQQGGEAQSKLPKWAQQLISKLERDVEYYKQKAYEAASAEPSNVRVHLGADLRNLPRNSQIQFTLANGTRIDVRLREEGELLDINSYDPMLVRPNASNSIYIESRKQ